MGIPFKMDPVGERLKEVDIFLQPIKPTINYPLNYTMADTARFSAECVAKMASGSRQWANLLALGGSGATGFFGLQSSNPSLRRFYWGNNANTTYTANVTIDEVVPGCTIKIDKLGLHINGDLTYPANSPSVRNKTDKIVVNLSNSYMYKKYTVMFDNAIVFNLIACLDAVTGTYYLKDSVSGMLIEATA